MDLALAVESALVDGSDLVGMSIDWSKCFDIMPQNIAFKLAERQGTHPRVLQPVLGTLWMDQRIGGCMKSGSACGAGNRRGHMSGIESAAGIDKIVTIQAMSSTKLPPEQRADSPMCLSCGEQPEDENHMLDARRERQIPNMDDRLLWPLCAWRCGIFLEDSEAVGCLGRRWCE